MKVLFLAPASSIHTVKWVNALSERGHDVYLVYQKDHAPAEGVVSPAVNLHMLKYSGAAGYYLNSKDLNHFCRFLDPDVINVHYASGYGTLARVAGLKNVILSFWGSDIYEFPRSSRLNRIILLKNIRHARYIASTSHCMAREVSRFSCVPEDEIAITPFGVDTTRFDPSLFQEKTGDTVTIGTVKALEEVYNIRGLIDGFAEYIKKFGKDAKGKVVLRIYGGGSQRDELAAMIKERRLEDRVFLMGTVPNDKVPEVLSEMDVFCALSRKESFGVAILEAMAMRVPVIASRAEGFKEILGNGTGGILLADTSPESVAHAIHDLVTDEKRSRELGSEGYRLVRDRYSWEKCVDIMCDLYESAKANNEKSIYIP